jgi:hypothetical protein
MVATGRSPLRAATGLAGRSASYRRDHEKGGDSTAHRPAANIGSIDAWNVAGDTTAAARQFS